MKVTVTHWTDEELRQRHQVVLDRLGLSYAELSERARLYLLTDDERDAWDEIGRIRFLLGERRGD